MAKTKGMISFSGSIGDITYIQGKHGNYAKERKAVSKDKIANSPNYARFRDYLSEFKEAHRVNRLLREPLKPFIGRCKDTRMTQRLHYLFMQALKKDTINPLGKRNVLDGELALLGKFEFNNSAALLDTMQVNITGIIDRSTGEASVSINSFVPEKVLKHMDKCTHVRLSIAVIAINFITGETQKQFLDGEYLPIDKEPTGPVTLSASLSAGLTDPILLLLKLQYFEEAGGRIYEHLDNSGNTCTILKVDTGV
jgi:hypothetical protein